MKCILFHHVNLKYSIVPASTYWLLLRTKFDPSSICSQWLNVLPIKEYFCFLEHLKLSFAKLYFKEKVPSFMADTDKRGRRVFFSLKHFIQIEEYILPILGVLLYFCFETHLTFNVNKQVKLRLTKTSRAWNKN